VIAKTAENLEIEVEKTFQNENISTKKLMIAKQPKPQAISSDKQSVTKPHKAGC
jgi:hypothetical protein